MYFKGALSHSVAVLAVELFEQGLSAKSAARALDLAPTSVQMLHERWQVRGTGALVTSERKQYDLETKLLIVRRHLQGASGQVLAKEYDLPSPGTVRNWAKIYRRDGEDGLRPKKRGRRPVDREDPVPESEVEQLRKENERLRAEESVPGKIAGLEITATTLKVQAVDDLKAHHRLSLLLKLAELPRSTFYDHRRRLTRPDRHGDLKEAIRVGLRAGAQRVWAPPHPGHAAAARVDGVEKDRVEAHAWARVAKPGTTPAQIQLLPR